MEKEKQEEAKKMRNEMKSKARQDSRQEIAVQAQKIQVHEERKEWEKGRRTRTEWHLKVSLMGCWTAEKGDAQLMVGVRRSTEVGYVKSSGHKMPTNVR